MFSATVSSTRRPFGAPLLAAAASLAIALTMIGTPVAGQATDLDAQGAAAVNEFIEILKQPDAEKTAALADFLAEEFQIVRNNGTRLDKTGYIENPATVFEVEISDVQATEADGVMVVSYTLSVTETIDGIETVSVAPRLSVFHRSESGDWQIAAHANFGALDPS